MHQTKTKIKRKKGKNQFFQKNTNKRNKHERRDRTKYVKVGNGDTTARQKP